MGKWRPERFVKQIESYKLNNDRFYCDWYQIDLIADAVIDAIWKMAEESPTKTFIFDASCLDNIYKGTFYARN